MCIYEYTNIYIYIYIYTWLLILNRSNWASLKGVINMLQYLILCYYCV